MKNPNEVWFRFNVKTQEWEWSFDPPYKRHELKFTRLVSVDNAAARIESLMAVPMASADFKEGVRRALVLLRATGGGTLLDAETRSMTDCMMTHHPSQPCTSCEARRRADKGTT